MNVWAICATAGRHTCLERSVRFFLDQDYEGPHKLLIFNNSETPQTISEEYNDRILLVNQCINSATGAPYDNLGAIYNDAIIHVPPDAEVIIFWDDDDIFLPSHISKGVEGLKSCEKTAYKPQFSFYRHSTGIEKACNYLEPSIFTKAQHIKNNGFSLTTSDQHMKWYKALGDDIFVDPDGIPTLVYNWGDNHIPTFKTSGNPGNIFNFDNYRSFSQDHGDGLITPLRKDHAAKYYEQVNSFTSGHSNSNQ